MGVAVVEMGKVSQKDSEKCLDREGKKAGLLAWVQRTRERVWDADMETEVDRVREGTNEASDLEAVDCLTWNFGYAQERFETQK